jgi:hypothetical protein
MTIEQHQLVARLYERSGFSAADAELIKKRRHTDYARRMDELAPTFEVLTVADVPRGAIKAVAEVTGIPLGTIKDWRSKLLHDPEWRPYENRNEHRRCLSREQEAELCREIVEQYIEPGFYCPPKVCQVLAARIYGREVEEKWAWDGDGAEDNDDSEASDDVDATDAVRHRHRRPRKAVFTRRWRQGFLRRHSLSLRRPHLRRRPRINDEVVAQFLGEIGECFDRCGRRNIFNTDETHWSIINPHQVTIAPRGTEGVSANFPCDPKLGVTAIATISAAGEKLPLWIICKGTTERCEKRFRQHFEQQIKYKQLVLCHQVSGWTDKVISKTVLRWLADRCGDSSGTLIWDVYAAHREEGVKAYAARKGIGLLYIPPGMTDTYQPLDRRIFGSLKARARARFDDLWVENPSRELSLVDAVEVLLEAWAAVTQEEILNAWAELDPEPIGE